MKNTDSENVRKFVGLLLALAKGNKPVQDLLVKEGFRSLIRKCLVEHSTISFHSEFSDLRDWIRGDRGGANSAVNTRGRVDAGEKNAAEAQLSKGTEVGPGRCCWPRHWHAFTPSCLELHGIL